MPDFVSHNESDSSDAPILAPAEDIPEGVPADALPAADDGDATATPAATEGEGAPSADAAAAPAPLTADRALNIAFGAALLFTDAIQVAAQKLSEQAEFVQNNTPAVLDALEEKGKPVRAAAMEKLRGAFSFTFTSGDSDDLDGDGLPDTSGDVDASDELPRPFVGAGTAAPLVPPVVAPVISGSAEAEISALERRVRELEQEVSKPLVVALPDAEAQPQPNGESDALGAADDGETTAEVATYDFADDAPGALADSPYAVSETPDEVNGETNEADKTYGGEGDPA